MANSSGRRSPAWLALGLVLVGFPVAVVHLLPLVPDVAAFLGGARSAWRAYWSFGAAVEWAFLTLVLLALWRGGGRPRSEIGLSLPRPSTALVLGLLGALALAAAVYLPGLPEARLERMPYGATMFFPPSNADDRLFWVFVAATAAICEEAMFRGIAIGELRRAGLPALVAALMSSAAFAYFHGGVEQGSILFAVRFAMGLALALLYLRLKSIWPAVGVHFALDASVLAAS